LKLNAANSALLTKLEALFIATVTNAMEKYSRVKPKIVEAKAGAVVVEAKAGAVEVEAKPGAVEEAPLIRLIKVVGMKIAITMAREAASLPILAC
jgi:hypothetical protein